MSFRLNTWIIRSPAFVSAAESASRIYGGPDSPSRAAHAEVVREAIDRLGEKFLGASSGFDKRWDDGSRDGFLFEWWTVLIFNGETPE